MSATYLVFAGVLISTCLNVYALAFISMIVSLITLIGSLSLGQPYPLGSAWQFACYLQVGYLSGLFFYGVWKSVSVA
jgi:hypothetical protein